MVYRPVIGPNEAVPVVQHHAIQVLVFSVEAHLNVTSEFWVALWPVGLLDLVTQQACHAFHLDLLLPDENLRQLPTLSCAVMAGKQEAMQLAKTTMNHTASLTQQHHLGVVAHWCPVEA